MDNVKRHRKARLMDKIDILENIMEKNQYHSAYYQGTLIDILKEIVELV